MLEGKIREIEICVSCVPIRFPDFYSTQNERFVKSDCWEQAVTGGRPQKSGGSRLRNAPK